MQTINTTSSILVPSILTITNMTENFSETKAATVVEDIAGALILYSDGSIVRRTSDLIVNVPPSADQHEEVESKDVVLHHRLGIWARLYLPLQRGTPALLPVVVYFHGGGFCFLSPATRDFHRFCLEWAAAVRAIIVSVSYRLAPEHRLPAAYEDSMAAVEWVHSQSINGGDRDADPWLKSYADFFNVYLMGDSAGANIVHHLIMKCPWRDWRSLEMRGAIMLQPFFGGQQRTHSEIECPEDAFVNLKTCDSFWRLALPLGATRNHPFSNPLGPESPSLFESVFPPLLVVVCGKDCLKERALEYCEALKKYGKRIEVAEFDEEEHGFCIHKLDCQSSRTLLQRAAAFISSNLSTC